MLKKRCRICGTDFHVPPKQASRRYCDRNACKLERHRKVLEKDRKRYARRHKPDIGRRCQRCGVNCYPNYFYCRECHQVVSTDSCFEGKDKAATCG